ncbi:hypothetical protein K3250_003811 [Salmonella enterica subsp. enterica]|nr:hypothetical protein [Salmonella enterica subsp. enterica serovar Wangata]EHY1226734.1 hypothetical protein [Salmonella enterica subsp. enterica]ELY1459917.1 hypothetical protein [Salmonella enterica]
MKEGYYWIQHVGVVQVAYYTNDTVDDLESWQVIVGVWHLTRGDDICHNGEAEVLSGPLQPPAWIQNALAALGRRLEILAA